MRAPFELEPLPLAGRLAAVLVLLLAGGTAQAREGAAPPAELERRLEAAEARIEQLEALVRDLVEQAAHDQVVPAREPRPAPQQTDPRASARPEPSATPAPASAASGSFTLSGLVQVWYSAGNESVRDSFRIRRAELSFNGEITKKAHLAADQARHQCGDELHPCVHNVHVDVRDRARHSE